MGFDPYHVTREAGNLWVDPAYNGKIVEMNIVWKYPVVSDPKLWHLFLASTNQVVTFREKREAHWLYYDKTGEGLSLLKFDVRAFPRISNCEKCVISLCTDKFYGLFVFFIFVSLFIIKTMVANIKINSTNIVA